jgi:hypothetical protein
MVARARTVETSGIGTGDSGTFVELNWASGAQAATVVLALSDRTKEADDFRVKLNWIDSKHLQITLQGQANVDFQAVKWHGVNIIVQENPTPTEKSTDQ